MKLKLAWFCWVCALLVPFIETSKYSALLLILQISMFVYSIIVFSLYDSSNHYSNSSIERNIETIAFIEKLKFFKEIGKNNG
jgi:hypothetical protein